MFRPLNKFEVLRDTGEASGGTDGGGEDPNAALREQNAQLLARVNKLSTDMDAMRSQTQQSHHQTQMAKAKAQIESAVTEAENAVNSAETNLRNALDEGDSAEIAKAHRQLADASASAEKRRADRDAFNREVRSSERRDGGQRTETSTSQSMDTTNLDGWKDRNKEWYGVDSEMTRVSHEIDQGIRAAGTYTVGSKEYFDAIDRALKQRFPDRFSGAPASAAARGENGDTPKNARRYDRDAQRSMEAFGLSPEQWDSARQKAVEKGFLPEKPARGRVLQ